MKARAAIVMIVAILAWPAVAQHGGSARVGTFGGGGHVGFSGHPGFSGHSGFSARPGFAARPGFSAHPGFAPHPGFSGHSGVYGPRSFAHPPRVRYGNFPPPAMGHFNGPHLSIPRFTGGRATFPGTRPPYQSGFSGGSSSWNHNGNRDWDHDGDRDRDRDRFRNRAGLFQNWYLFGYPGSLGYLYPYVLDPWLFSGQDYGSSGYDNSGYAQNYDNSGYDQSNQASGYNDQVSGYQPESANGNYAAPGGEAYGEPSIENYGPPGAQPPPWPGPGASGTAPENQPSDSGLHAAFEPPLDGPLTVVFKSGRAPEQMQDYMLTAKMLTDLDTHHYEQIPLDQIDIAATVKANRASGEDFQVPGASRD